MLDDTKIETILAREPDPARACRRLIDAASAAGGNDNVTVLIVAIESY